MNATNTIHLTRNTQNTCSWGRSWREICTRPTPTDCTFGCRLLRALVLRLTHDIPAVMCCVGKPSSSYSINPKPEKGIDIIVYKNVPKVSRWAPQGDILLARHAFFRNNERSVGRKDCVTRGERAFGFFLKQQQKLHSKTSAD